MLRMRGVLIITVSFIIGVARIVRALSSLRSVPLMLPLYILLRRCLMRSLPWCGSRHKRWLCLQNCLLRAQLRVHEIQGCLLLGILGGERFPLRQTQQRGYVRWCWTSGASTMTSWGHRLGGANTTCADSPNVCSFSFSELING
ncbi:hypothetical protein HanRHA438_Chr17g0818631 [Helianthus annuus]|nr:hypothetical protein HanRHA438_Chr17g0818631 [Helianthus annuus]